MILVLSMLQEVEEQAKDLSGEDHRHLKEVFQIIEVALESTKINSLEM